MRTALLRIGEREPAGGYPVTLSIDGAVAAEALIPRDLDEGSVAELLGDGDTVERIRAFVLGARERSGRARQIGDYLHGLLCRDDVATGLGALAAQQEPTRILLDIRAEALRGLPWELIRRNRLFLFASPVRPWARVRAEAALTASAADAPVESCPLRLLIVVGSAEEDIGLAAEDEVRAIVSVLPGAKTRVERHVLWRPAREQLRSMLEWGRPHILHFIGHSVAEEDESDPEAVADDALAIEAPGQSWEYTSEQIAVDLESWQPNLVVINACRSAGDGASAVNSDVVFRVASAYVEREVRPVAAVLAMQGDVAGVAAVHFAEAFYRSLLVNREAVDVAVARARQSAPGNFATRDFAFPCLTLNRHPDDVLPLYSPASTIRAELDDTYDAEPFLDRWRERGELGQRLDRVLWKGAQDSPLLSLTGDRGSGRSYVLRWTLWMEALRGRNVAYVSLRDKEDDPRRHWREILDIIRERLERSPACGADNRAAFAGLDLDEVYDHGPGDDPVERTVTAFRERLGRAAGSSGLLIAIDHLAGADDEFAQTLGPHLLRPVAERRPARVGIIVVRSTDRDESAHWPFADGFGEQIPVAAFDPALFKPLAMELMYWYAKTTEDAAAAAHGLSAFGRTWSTIAAIDRLCREAR